VPDGLKDMKKVVMAALRSGAVGLAGLVLAMVDCVSIAGLKEGIPIVCSVVEDCVAEECRSPMACTEGECVHKNAVEGTVLEQQQQGDCAERVCDGAGKVKTVPLAIDPPVGGVCAQCGDGNLVMEDGEECDDGGRIDGDRCSATCQNETIEAVAAGGSHTCALVYKRSVIRCWGFNQVGQLGLGDTANRGDQADELGKYLPPLRFSTPAVAIAAGDDHTCALLKDGRVICWGENGDGQLGLGDMLPRGNKTGETGDALASVSLGTNLTATAIAAGFEHTCALLNDGSVKCWGDNGFGQLGVGASDNRGNHGDELGDMLPTVNLGAGQTATAIAAGARHTCALLDDRSVKCWGLNTSGQLGVGDTLTRGDMMGYSLAAIDLGASKTVSAIAVGASHTCALLDDRSVKCWGDNQFGQLGRGDTQNRGDGPTEMGDNLLPIPLGTDMTAMAIATGANHTCALLSNGSIKCWGANYEGQLGRGDTQNRGDGPNEMGDNLPAIDLGARKAVAISSGLHHICARLDDSSLKCWGDNQFGQLGLGDTTNRGLQPDQMGDNLPTVKLF
jgi:cysteine-rich repeat protein